MASLFEESATSLESEDLFGSTYPEDYDPENPPKMKSKGYGRVQVGRSGSKCHKREHYPRAYKILTEMFGGGKYWKCDYMEVTYNGMMVSKDMLGFMDVCGITPDGRWVSANITTLESIAAHLRKYSDLSKTHGQAKIPIVRHLREYLECGGRFFIIGFHKPGRLWEHKLVEVTDQMISEYEARKRKR